MGDIADSIINGDFCEVCGEYLGSEGGGFPRTCEGCLQEEQITRKLYCCGCKKKVNAVLVEGYDIYPHREDLWDKKFYQCECGLYVGCHPNSERPLGCMATKEIKKARQKIHKILDPLWENKGKGKRTKLYKRLSDKLGYEYHTAGIRDIEEAGKIYKLVQTIRKEIFIDN